MKIVLVGNPNCGKTTIFNLLTGANNPVGNYSGVTVEVTKGSVSCNNIDYELVDLPGIYSLSSLSKDEMAARDYLLENKPDIIVNVVDSSNIERNLFLSLQLIELGIPLILVLNMIDLAHKKGCYINAKLLADHLGVRVIEIDSSKREGADDVLCVLEEAFANLESFVPAQGTYLKFSPAIETELSNLQQNILQSLNNFNSTSLRVDEEYNPLSSLWLLTGESGKGLTTHPLVRENANIESRAFKSRLRWLAVKLLENDRDAVQAWKNNGKISSCSGEIQRSEKAPLVSQIASERYKAVQRICEGVITKDVKVDKRSRFTDKIDALLTHPFWGIVIFFATMYGVFWLTFTLGEVPVCWLEQFQSILCKTIKNFWSDNPDSILCSLIVDGIISGVGGVLVFFPNIFILFAAIATLEESGYIARGAFLMDRYLSKVGLTGKSFIPLLVGFGCSVPAVMAARIIEDKKLRLITIFIVPLMSCGARFPIYMLIIPAFFPKVWQAPILWSIYILGIILALILAIILNRGVFKGNSSPLLIELPTYHLPTMRTVGKRACERAIQYLQKAGSTILGVSVILWAISSFPALSTERLAEFESRESDIRSVAQRLQIDLEALDQPLEPTKRDSTAAAFPWDEKITEEKILKLAPNDTKEQQFLLQELLENNQNECMEAQLENSVAGRLGRKIEPVLKLSGFDWRIGIGLIGAFAAKEVFVAQLGVVFKSGEVDESSETLRSKIQRAYTPLVGICVLVFCLISAPCMATFVIVFKETSFKWACGQWLVLTVLGFCLSCSIFQVGRFFNWG